MGDLCPCRRARDRAGGRRHAVPAGCAAGVHCAAAARPERCAAHRSHICTGTGLTPATSALHPFCGMHVAAPGCHIGPQRHWRVRCARSCAHQSGASTDMRAQTHMPAQVGKRTRSIDGGCVQAPLCCSGPTRTRWSACSCRRASAARSPQPPSPSHGWSAPTRQPSAATVHVAAAHMPSATPVAPNPPRTTLQWRTPQGVGRAHLPCVICLLTCSTRTLSCGIRTVPCGIHTLPYLIRTLSCGIHTLPYLIRTPSCGIRSLPYPHPFLVSGRWTRPGPCRATSSEARRSSPSSRSCGASSTRSLPEA
jgi:hypothetical protein